MRTSRLTGLIAFVAAIGWVASASHAAFIVEPRTGGKAFSNFSTGNDTGTPSTSTASSTAAGTTAGLGSVFGGASTTTDQYIFSYTPGVNADNTVLAPGADLGLGNTATGLVGGLSGVYNVYATWPQTNNISSPTGAAAGTPTNYSAASDTGPISVDLSQDSDAGGVGNVWNLIGTVQLTAGQTYIVTQTAPNSLFVSMRSAGVMWEYVGPIIPEPTAFVLAGLGLPGLITARRRSA